MVGGGGRVVRVLNVAEKPSVAKAVSGILSKNQPGGMRVRDGRSRYNKIFEFNYTIRNQPCQMLFTSVTGHLMELEFDERYRKWHSCDPLDLYNAPVRKFVPEVPLYPIYLLSLSPAEYLFTVYFIILFTMKDLLLSRGVWGMCKSVKMVEYSANSYMLGNMEGKTSKLFWNFEIDLGISPSE
ncbi:hypothetical protein MTR67_046517 [Solanum verrucosum]|uniref:DNA topoisomerase n=1 Tax=Solanum verrucosum TaxID=315347 RepID=A0AAF0ZUM5_SOLVR|nr:hypothetical protein MTR67_046517 [Solanum verrucosum]